MNELICKNEIIDIIIHIRSLLFPGYFECESSKESIEDSIKAKLVKQIKRAGEMASINLDSNELTNKIINSIPEIKDTLQTDLEAFYEGDPAATDYNEIIFSYPGMFAISIHRLAHVLYQLHIPYIPRIMSEYAHEKTGIDIHPGAQIGKYFFIDHGTGIVIGETTIIGEHVRIYQGVTLGALSLRAGQKLKGSKRHPTIGNNVIIYSGASILGGDTIIGNNVTIGSNAFILESIPDNCIARIDKVNLEVAKKHN